jgi:hypothetical protein
MLLLNSNCTASCSKRQVTVSEWGLSIKLQVITNVPGVSPGVEGSHFLPHFGGVGHGHKPGRRAGHGGFSFYPLTYTTVQKSLIYRRSNLHPTCLLEEKARGPERTAGRAWALWAEALFVLDFLVLFVSRQKERKASKRHGRLFVRQSFN